MILYLLYCLILSKFYDGYTISERIIESKLVIINVLHSLIIGNEIPEFKPLSVNKNQLFLIMLKIIMSLEVIYIHVYMLQYCCCFTYIINIYPFINII